MLRINLKKLFSTFIVAGHLLVGLSVHAMTAVYSASQQINIKIYHEIIQYHEKEIFWQHFISSHPRNYKVENSTWQLELKKNTAPSKNVVDVNAIFKITDGILPHATAAVCFHFDDWDTQNYLMVPAAIYNGNRFRAIPGGYCPDYPADMFYNPNAPISFSDNPRLSLLPNESSQFELLTAATSTPALVAFSPAKKHAVIILTTQGTPQGDYGLTFEENADRTSATFRITAPGVRKRVAGFGDFSASKDTALTWTKGLETSIRYRMYAFKANSVAEVLKKFASVRKDLSGNEPLKPRVPMSAELDFIRRQTDKNRWHESENASLYFPENTTKSFQIGWVSGLINTFPMMLVNDSLHLQRALSTIDFALRNMQGASGYFYGNLEIGNGVTCEKKMPASVMEAHPTAKNALVRKNADLLYWLCKQFLWLKAMHPTDKIHPEWETAVRKIADAFCKTWNENHDLGQYIDPATGEIVVYNTTGGALAPAGLALAANYFSNPAYLKTAEEIAGSYYSKFIAGLGFTNGACGDISQDADSETAFALLDSFVGLYEATGDVIWLNKAEGVAGLCSTWTNSYHYLFRSDCDLRRLNVNTTGAVWASTQNKHAAPGVCTSSANQLFRLYRATGNHLYAELLKDIQHAHAEVTELPGRSTVTLRSGKASGSKVGCSMERIQTSDAEGAGAKGNLINTSNGWTETNGMLMALEIPGIYVQTDNNELFVFDHLEVISQSRTKSSVTLTLKNPTDFDALTTVFSETSAKASMPMIFPDFIQWKKIAIPAHQIRTITINEKNISIIHQ